MSVLIFDQLLVIRDFTHNFKYDGESGSCTHFTVYFDGATHLLNDHFADGQAQTTASRVFFPVFLQIVEVNKKII